jgi:hypothetical protein
MRDKLDIILNGAVVTSSTYYPSTCQEGLKSLSQDCRCPDRDSKGAATKYKSTASSVDQFSRSSSCCVITIYTRVYIYISTCRKRIPQSFLIILLLSSLSSLHHCLFVYVSVLICIFSSACL